MIILEYVGDYSSIVRINDVFKSNSLSKKLNSSYERLAIINKERNDAVLLYNITVSYNKHAIPYSKQWYHRNRRDNVVTVCKKYARLIKNNIFDSRQVFKRFRQVIHVKGYSSIQVLDPIQE